jgi:hypothetical protein
VVGFKVLGMSELDAEVPELDEIWIRPRFDVPLLDLESVSAGESLR